MSQEDMRRTRTAQVRLDLPDGAIAFRARPGGRAARTEILPLAVADAAAVSFARERERALMRLDHSASVRRLRRALSIGLVLWVSVLTLDVFITRSWARVTCAHLSPADWLAR